MKYCCEKMEYFLSKKKSEENFNSDDAIVCYTPQFDEYGIIIHDGGHSYVEMKYCPWCGHKLPESKRDLWFDELEKLGIENPLEDDIPKKFKSAEWWLETRR